MRKKIFNYSLFSFLLIQLMPFASKSGAQVPSLVKDINQGTVDGLDWTFGDTIGSIQYNNIELFRGIDNTTGVELWRSDGTNTGTYLVKDIYQGTASSSPSNFFYFNGYIYFKAADNLNNFELWRTDGTDSGTYVVSEIDPDIYSGGLNFLDFKIVWTQNNSFFFVAHNDGSYNDELWKSDGTIAGTQVVKEINAGGGVNGESAPHDFITFNNELFFIASQTIPGASLWKTDGSNAGTVLVKNNGMSRLEKVWEQNGVFYFITRFFNNSEFEFWKSDGSDLGTEFLSGVLSGYNESFTLLNNELVYIGHDSLHGYELWATDGTISGTQLIKDIRPGPELGINKKIWKHNGEVFFIAQDSLYNWELWKTDGTTIGTSKVKEINPTTSSYIQSVFEFNNELYFSANDGSVGTELWKTDGTTTGTILVKDIWLGPNSSIQGGPNNSLQNIWEHNGSFYFVAANGDILNQELWKSDGTDSGTVLVKEINPSLQGGNPSGFVQFNNQLFFSANDGSNGNELWKTNGTGTGTILVKNIAQGNYSSLAYSQLKKLFEYNGSFYFIADSQSTSDKEIWRTDGTSAETTLTLDINPGYIGSNPTGFTILNNNYVLFKATNPILGSELWSFNLPGITGLPDLAINKYVVYPNPSNGVYYFSNVKSFDDANYIINIFDLEGKIIFNKSLANLAGSIDISDSKSGIYFLQIKSSKELFTYKIIKL